MKEMHRTKLQLLRAGALSVVWLALAQASFAATSNPFFAMDTALGHGDARTPAAQAAMLKELGCQGIGTSGYPTDDFLTAFEKEGLKVYNTYLTLSFDSSKPELDPSLRALVPRLKGHGTALWLAISGVTVDGVKLECSASKGDDLVVKLMRELADLAKTNQVDLAFYPHTGCWLERVEDAIRVAGKINRPNAGVTFNLCHWLKVEGDRDPRPILKEAMPRLFFVSLNGAERGDTRNMNWDKLIQPLDAGSYDVAGLMKTLRDLGYMGPIGFQGYGIPGDSRELMRRTMEGWRRVNAPRT